MRRTAAPMPRTPETDIYETQEAIVLSLDLPGLEQEDLSVEFENGVLSVHGRVRPADFGKRTPAIQEYPLHEYRRHFQLPEGFRWDAIDAQLRDGVLTITVPKAEEARPRRIPVKGS